jgi:hypothetical protein
MGEPWKKEIMTGRSDHAVDDTITNHSDIKAHPINDESHNHQGRGGTKPIKRNICGICIPI